MISGSQEQDCHLLQCCFGLIGTTTGALLQHPERKPVLIGAARIGVGFPSTLERCKGEDQELQRFTRISKLPRERRYVPKRLRVHQLCGADGYRPLRVVRKFGHLFERKGEVADSSMYAESQAARARFLSVSPFDVCKEPGALSNVVLPESNADSGKDRQDAADRLNPSSPFTGSHAIPCEEETVLIHSTPCADVGEE